MSTPAGSTVYRLSKRVGARGGVVVDLQSEVDITEEGPLTRLLRLHSEGRNLE